MGKYMALYAMQSPIQKRIAVVAVVAVVAGVAVVAVAPNMRLKADGFAAA
jgi:hypothetical protein